MTIDVGTVSCYEPNEEFVPVPSSIGDLKKTKRALNHDVIQLLSNDSSPPKNRFERLAFGSIELVRVCALRSSLHVVIRIINKRPSQCG